MEIRPTSSYGKSDTWGCTREMQGKCRQVVPARGRMWRALWCIFSRAQTDAQIRGHRRNGAGRTNKLQRDVGRVCFRYAGMECVGGRGFAHVASSGSNPVSPTFDRRREQAQSVRLDSKGKILRSQHSYSTDSPSSRHTAFLVASGTSVVSIARRQSRRRRGRDVDACRWRRLRCRGRVLPGHMLRLLDIRRHRAWTLEDAWTASRSG